MAEYKDDEKAKHLFEVIKRIDAYILSTNQKCAIVISYCAAVVGWLSINLNKILNDLSTPYLYWGGVVCVSALILFSCICIWLSIAVIFPITNSSSERENDDSIIFFGDIALAKRGAGGYLKRIKKMKLGGFLEDLGQQVFTLATIADIKFKKIKRMTRYLCLGNILPLGVLLFIILVNAMLGWFSK